MPAPASAFRSSNRSSMGSNTYTTQAQGGGSAKAGFPYQIGRPYRTSIALNTCNPDLTKTIKCCASLNFLQFTKTPLASVSRPIGATQTSNRYFHIPGTGK